MKPKTHHRSLGRVSPRLAYRFFYPQVPVIVCSKLSNEIAAMPASSCMSISDRPAMIALAVRKVTKTALTISAGKSFSLNWLTFDPEAERTVLELAKPIDYSKSRGYDKLRENKIPYFPVKGQPVLSEAEGFMICRLERRIESGDHYLFIARILLAKASKDFLSSKYWDFKDYKPMLYLGSAKKKPIATLSICG